ncbi:hypothetical protein MUCCIDRAFT_81363 [Mucor lusitanicus CBS 277.49]|uniref:Uncharacterized protein n=1 Tax=Mucor lusitanicus CBS 277.49 TaxID=747725 RepID=A0A168LCQ0_MUCCL|nr:hypothetical protein MUCCIDRAFT_81363 [Mucor lusitanicus CBS 277.49]
MDNEWHNFDFARFDLVFVDYLLAKASHHFWTFQLRLFLVSYYFERNTEEDLRNALICMLSHYLYLRGSSARVAELADLQSVEPPNVLDHYTLITPEDDLITIEMHS